MRMTASIVATSVLSSALTAFFVNGFDHSASARAVPLRQDLGPADALVLSGKSDLRITNADGRISWSDQPSSRTFSIATVHVGRILGALLQSDKYTSEKSELSSQMEKKAEEFEARYTAMLEKAKGIDKDSPEFPTAREEFESFQQEYAAWNSEVEKLMSEMSTRHYQTAYADLREAVEVVSDRRKIDLVMRFIPASDKIVSGDELSIGQQLMARTFLRSPDSIDITEDILTEMNLQAPKKD
ncbi:MAG: OmpH family outer membrane protein [Planctomycetota bacterium]|nr:OmpH family outer membrane protein [Planctomycetota bacterium]